MSLNHSRKNREYQDEEIGFDPGHTPVDDDILAEEDELLTDDWEESSWETETAAADEEPPFADRKRHTDRKRHSRAAMKRRQKANVTKVGLLTAAGLAVLLIAGFFIQRNMPSSARMSGYDYFGLSQDTNRVMVLLDGEQMNDIGIEADGRLYLPQTFVAENLNVRFYYDTESNAVLYSDANTIFSFSPDSTEYSDLSGQKHSAEAAVVKTLEDQLYLDFEFVAARTSCAYVYGKEPNRVVIRTGQEEVFCVTAQKDISVRYRAGIKSKVLEKISAGEELLYSKAVDEDWCEVTTAAGFTGYVQNKGVSEPFTKVFEYAFTESYSNFSRDYPINMVWYQVTNTTANNYIDSYLAQTQGINTLSPTWYSIAGEQGELSSLASAEFVNKMHARGIEVWPLVNDFDKSLDYKALYSSQSARSKMIDQLLADAARYGYDGINIDFENIRTEYGQDFLQFIRELSIACQAQNLVLSTDNYKPAPYNSCYNLKEQSVFVDYVIIMGYDEHYAGSDAGSVASLPFVTEAIADTVKLVPSSQIIHALPFYTRIWTESSSGTTSRAVGMQAAIDDLKANGAVALWDETVGQYFGSYEKDGATIKIWFEEDQSIEEKLKVVQQYQLAGVSGWKLGLEKSSVWQVIHTYLGNQ